MSLPFHFASLITYYNSNLRTANQGISRTRLNWKVKYLAIKRFDDFTEFKL